MGYTHERMSDEDFSTAIDLTRKIEAAANHLNSLLKEAEKLRKESPFRLEPKIIVHNNDRGMTVSIGYSGQIFT